MEYNLRNASRKKKSSLYATALTSFGIFGVLFYIFCVICSILISAGIPIGILWCIFHFIHNGYKW